MVPPCNPHRTVQANPLCANLQGWVKSGQLPMFCNDTATPLNSKSKRTSATRGVKVFR